MKALKRFAVAVMAAAMLVVAAAAPAFADEYKITINGTATGHKYEAYQVFTGDLDGLVLSNIVWGDGVNASGLLDALKGDKYFGEGAANKFYSCNTAKDVAMVLADATFRADQNNVRHFADVVAANLTSAAYTPGDGQVTDTKYVITVDEAGYYLIKDKDGSVKNYDAYTDYILEVVANTEISPKSAVPTLTKQVQSADHSTYGNGANALYSTKVQFRLAGTMPTNIAVYESYYYEIRDVLPSGLSLANPVNMSVVVYNNGNEVAINADNYTFVLNPDGDEATNDFAIVFRDVKKAILDATKIDAITEDQIVVTYDAVVNNNAVLGKGTGEVAGNKNVAYLIFSNDPNEAYNAAGTALPSVGQTPEDAAWVYTYQLTVNKVDEQDKSLGLAGAQFHLYRIDGTTKMYAVANEIKSGVYEYSNTTADVDAATPFTTDAKGKLVIKGVSARALHLDEIKSPSGYNKPSESIGVTISSTIDATGNLTALNGVLTSGTGFSTVAADINSGNVTVTISNTKGQTLPETGGMGTTVFYLLGAVMVIGAAAVLAMGRRGSDRY